MKSIRNFLLVSISILVMLALLISGLLSYQRAQYEVDELFDAELAQTARVLQSTLSLTLPVTTSASDHTNHVISTHDWQEKDVAGKITHNERTRFGHSYERKIMFKVIRNNQLLLESDNAPPLDELPPEPGYRQLRISAHKWYTFTLIDETTTYLVGERSDVRKEMVQKIARSYFYPSLLSMPILLLILAWTLRTGLQPLAELDTKIQQRDKDNLDPIVVEHSPREISPIVQSLNGLLQRLRRSLESERRFTATASHEIRTPIAVLKLNVQNALHADNESQRLQLLKELDASVDRAGRLINQLLALHRLEQDDHGFAPHQVDILALLREEIAGLYPLALRKNQTIELNNDDTTLSLESITQLLELLFRNLLDNAIKYTPENGRISVSVFADENQIQIQIEDSGPGVNEDQRNKIFERFYRIAQGDVPGSGLGLAIVSRALQLLKGRIEVSRSKTLGGMCVNVWINRKNSPVPGKNA